MTPTITLKQNDTVSSFVNLLLYSLEGRKHKGGWGPPQTQELADAQSYILLIYKRDAETIPSPSLQRDSQRNKGAEQLSLIHPGLICILVSCPFCSVPQPLSHHFHSRNFIVEQSGSNARQAVFSGPTCSPGSWLLGLQLLWELSSTFRKGTRNF